MLGASPPCPGCASSYPQKRGVWQEAECGRPGACRVLCCVSTLASALLSQVPGLVGLELKPCLELFNTDMSFWAASQVSLRRPADWQCGARVTSWLCARHLLCPAQLLRATLWRAGGEYSRVGMWETRGFVCLGPGAGPQASPEHSPQVQLPF